MYNFSINYRPGQRMQHADYMSRLIEFQPESPPPPEVQVYINEQEEPPIRRIHITKEFQDRVESEMRRNYTYPHRPTRMSPLRSRQGPQKPEKEIVRRTKTRNQIKCERCHKYVKPSGHRCRSTWISGQPLPSRRYIEEQHRKLEVQKDEESYDDAGGWAATNYFAPERILQEESERIGEYDHWPKYTNQWDEDEPMYWGPEPNY